MNRLLSVLALLVLAALSIVGVSAVTRPARIESRGRPTTTATTVTVPAQSDAGSLDSMLDAVRVEHALKYGR